MTPWFAAFAPAGTPPEIVAKLNALMRQVLGDPKVKATLDSIGSEPIGGSPEELKTYLAKEAGQGKKLAEERNIKLQ